MDFKHVNIDLEKALKWPYPSEPLKHIYRVLSVLIRFKKEKEANKQTKKPTQVQPVLSRSHQGLFKKKNHDTALFGNGLILFRERGRAEGLQKQPLTNSALTG